MRIFKISDYLGDDIERILKSRGMLYLRKDDHTIKVDLSGHQYRRIVARAQCEKRNREENLPENVYVYGWEKENEKLLHFVNVDGQRPVRQVHPWQKLVFRIKENKRVESVESILEGERLIWKQTDGWLQIELEQLKIWDMIAIRTGE